MNSASLKFESSKLELGSQSDNFSTLGATENPFLWLEKNIEMAEIYKVVDIEGKGLGCVASTDIKRGSLILNENPQIQSSGINHGVYNNYYRVPGEILNEARQNGHLAEWIKSLLKSFNQMNRADQLEFMTLCNIKEFSLSEKKAIAEMSVGKASLKLDNLDWMHRIDEMTVKTVKAEIETFEKDPENAEKLLEICNIFASNWFLDLEGAPQHRGVAIKTSRFNHSCQPNATALLMPNGQNQIRAIKDIKQGEEINISYLGGFDVLQNTFFRQNHLFLTWHFVCLCDLCKNRLGANTDALDPLQVLVQEYSLLSDIQESAIYSKKRRLAYASNFDAEPSMYPLETCRREIKSYKEIFEISETLKVQHIAMFMTLKKGFKAAVAGYSLHKLPEFKCDAKKFAKAITIKKFEKILGNEVVNQDQPDIWKQRNRNFEMWMLDQKSKEIAQINAEVNA